VPGITKSFETMSEMWIVVPSVFYRSVICAPTCHLHLITTEDNRFVLSWRVICTMCEIVIHILQYIDKAHCYGEEKNLWSCRVIRHQNRTGI